MNPFRDWWERQPHDSKVTYCLLMFLAGILIPAALSATDTWHLPMAIITAAIWLLIVMASVTWSAVLVYKFMKPINESERFVLYLMLLMVCIILLYQTY